MAKNQRQHQIALALQSQNIISQTQIVDILAKEGIVATQATVSRDLEDMGAVKVRLPGGDLVYAIPELPKDQLAPGDHLQRILGDWAVEINFSGNLIVIKTPPGSAHVVAAALDRARLPEIIGTIAGDDTIFCAVANEVDIESLFIKLSDLAGLSG